MTQYKGRVKVEERRELKKPRAARRTRTRKEPEATQLVTAQKFKKLED